MTRQARELRGERRKAAASAMADLRDRGCAAAGYRLAGAVLDHVCCRYLRRDDRMLTVWPAEDHAIVLAIGRHDASTENVYAVLLDALDLDIADAERTKPLCCDQQGRPPADSEIATLVADTIERRARRGRRR